MTAMQFFSGKPESCIERLLEEDEASAALHASGAIIQLADGHRQRASTMN